MATEPIACTLTAAELAETQRAWRRLLNESLVDRREIPGGLRLQVHPGSAGALRALIEIERECCRWISFDLQGPTVEMTSSPEGEAVIREMWGG